MYAWFHAMEAVSRNARHWNYRGTVDDGVQIREIDFNVISNVDIPINHRDLFLWSERMGSP